MIPPVMPSQVERISIMGKIRLDLDMKKLGKMAVESYVAQNKGKCAYCHKPVKSVGRAKPDQLPVCAECARKHHLS